jgi:hypothetical protein
MAKSSKKKYNGKKKKETYVTRSPFKEYAVSNNEFKKFPFDLLRRLTKSNRVLPRLVLYKHDVAYLLNFKPHQASRLIARMRKTKKQVDGQSVFIKEICACTFLREERVYRYLLSLTINERILS